MSFINLIFISFIGSLIGNQAFAKSLVKNDVQAVVNPYHTEGDHSEKFNCKLRVNFNQKKLKNNIILVDLSLDGLCNNPIYNLKSDFDKIGFWYIEAKSEEKRNLSKFHWAVDSSSGHIKGWSCLDPDQDEDGNGCQYVTIGKATFDKSGFVKSLSTKQWGGWGDYFISTSLKIEGPFNKSHFKFDYVNSGDDWNGSYLHISTKKKTPVSQGLD